MAAESNVLPLTIKVILSPLRAGEDLCKCEMSELQQMGSTDCWKFRASGQFVSGGYKTAIWKKPKILPYVTIIINTPGPKNKCKKNYFIRVKKCIWDMGLSSWRHKTLHYGEHSKDSASRFQL